MIPRRRTQLIPRNNNLKICIIPHYKKPPKDFYKCKYEILEIKEQIKEEYQKIGNNKTKKLWYDHLLLQKLWSNKLLKNVFTCESINCFSEIDEKNLNKYYLNPFNTYYNYYRFLLLKDITFVSTNDGEQLLKLQKFLISDFNFNSNFSYITDIPCIDIEKQKKNYLFYEKNIYKILPPENQVLYNIETLRKIINKNKTNPN